MDEPIGKILKRTEVIRCNYNTYVFLLLDFLYVNKSILYSTFFMSFVVHFVFQLLLLQLSDGLVLDKTSSPLGVLLVIFESRPEALVQVYTWLT